jgi:hypothetical protein
MPRVSQFFGIAITMYYNGHNPPHFHARHGNDEALIDLTTLETLNGGLPRRAYGLVLEWAAAHRLELSSNWEKARAGLPLDPIAPLE